MTKFHKSVGRVQFVVFEKLTSAYLNQTAWEIMFLFNNLHEKNITERQDWQILIVCAICNLRLFYNFATVLHKKYTYLQPIRCVWFFHVYY